MKRSWIIVVLVLFSCKNNSYDKSFENSTMKESDVEEFRYSKFEKVSNFSELNIIEEKLQEIYDLIYLAKSKNDFNSSSISSTFEDYNKLLDTLKLKASPEISEIVQIGNSRIINDSITYITFKYEIQSQQEKKYDTLIAIIKKQKLIIDGIKTTAMKIDFEKSKTNP